ncbi:phasin family protein [Microvirga massiliensis]|uniref:phasin family protein n=1 Tax=Microvirga massiliensis TaxID=1033741 RepID=UPI00065FCE02|nr:phasin family protein [Microvirga massiliensis]
MAETRKNTSETVNETVEAGRETVETAADVVQEAAVVGLDGIRRATDQFTRALGLTGQESEALTRQASENLGALAETSTVLMRGMQDVSREWLTLSQHGLQKNIDGLTQLARCRSMQDLVAIQSELLRNNWHYMIDVSRQLAEHSIEIANEAAQTISSETKPAANRARKAA